MPCKHLGEQKQSVKVGCEGIDSLTLYRKTYECDIHGRCIKTYNPNNQVLERWLEKEESKIYKLCQQCPQFAEISE